VGTAFDVAGSSSWLGGTALTAGLNVLGLATLITAARELNLARAAQESAMEGRVATARQAGLTDVADDLRQQMRQGAYHTPTRLAGWTGAGALLWKGLVQVSRGPRLKTLTWGAVLAGTGAGLSLPTGIGARLLPTLVLGLMMAQRAPERLRRDMSAGWLLAQVPHPWWQLLLGNLVVPVGGALLCVAAGTAFGAAIGGTSLLSALTLLILLPGSLLAAALGGAVDLLRSNQATSGQLYPVGTLGLILGILGVGGPLGLLWGVGGTAGFVLGLAAGGLLDLVLLKAAVWFRYRPS
jgi:hypothetical protein